jgi:RNA polymerase sigma factor (sigma-70 family)
MKTRTMLAGALMLGLICTGTLARVKLVALPDRDAVTVRLDNPAATLVEEERVLTLQQGINKIDFSWQGVQIDENSIRIKVLSHPEQVTLLSVSYPPNEPALVWRIHSEEAVEEKVRISYLLAGIDRLVTYKALADKGRMIRIPVHMLNTIKKCYMVAKHLTQVLGRNPSAEELARYMHTDVKKIMLIHRLSQETTSLDLPVDADQSTKLVDLIGDRAADEPFESVFFLTLQDTLQRVLHKLSAREMRIIKLRFGLDCDGPHSLEETGKLLGITRERVRQIQEKAIMKLKDSRQILELWNNW